MSRRRGSALLALALLASAGPAAARTVPLTARSCQRDNFSPATRTLAPVAVFKTTGAVTSPTAVLSGGATRLAGPGAALTLDFGKDVAGIVTMRFSAVNDARQTLGLAFSESSSYVGTTSDASNGGPGSDGSLTAAVPQPGAGRTSSYTVPAAELRGGFRYLTVFLRTGGSVTLTGVSLAFTAAPGVAHPNAYPSSFCSNDRLLDRIWYAGAYTTQLDTIDPTQGRVWPPPPSGWSNAGVVGVGSSVLVDGAKRDRTVWPGDYGISVPTDLASLGDTSSIRNGLTTLYDRQDAIGALPYAGPEVNFPGEASDAYHLWLLIATADYERYSGDTAWLDANWSRYQSAVNYAIDKLTPLTGVFVVTGTSDWARSDQGGINLEANALMYEVLVSCAQLATEHGDASLAGTCTSKAATLKTSINSLLWDPSAGAYKDDPTGSTSPPTVLHPQDGNALAVWFGLTQTPAQNASILAYLKRDWTPLGATTPEWSGNIHPFPGSMEVYARFAAGDDAGAQQLIRTEWGYMLASPKGTGSTFWEGYTAKGAPGYNATNPSDPAGDYTSLAHGWSTGPTGALTYYVLGVQPTAPGGTTYSVIPHPGDLQWVNGRLALPAGSVSVAWSHTPRAFTLTVADRGPHTQGLVAIPTLGADRVVYVNGVKAWDGTRAATLCGIASVELDAGYIRFHGVAPGTRTFAWGAGSRRPAKAGRSRRCGPTPRRPALRLAAGRAAAAARHPVQASARWKRYVEAPTSPEVAPVRVVSTGGQVSDPTAVLEGHQGMTTLTYPPGGAAPVLVLDYGKEVGGLIQFTVASASSATQLQSSYSEVLQNLSAKGDGGPSTASGSGSVHRFDSFSVSGPTSLTGADLQGGERYELVTLTKPGAVSLSSARIKYIAGAGTPSAYQGHFLSSSDLLNRIWYAGAYTINLDEVNPGTPGVAEGTSVQTPNIVDGAKRDRDIWDGDMIVEGPTGIDAFGSNALPYLKGSLEILGAHPAPDPVLFDPSGSPSGMGPMSATCAGDAGGGCAFYSATYAMDFVLDVYQYYLYTGDEAFLRAEWPMVKRELAWENSQIDPLNGLFMTTPADSADWAVEFSHPAGDYAAPSVLHYQSLLDGGALAAALGDATDAQAYVAAAAAEKGAINTNLWDGALGAYDASTLERGWLVQDANVWAVLYGVASPSQSQTILAKLAEKLTVPYGMLDFAAGAGPDYTEHLVSPYISSFALWADYQDGRPDLALSLMRSEWGWMVNHDPGGVDWERIEAGGALAAADSAAHGWGTGATPALSQYVLGIQPVTPGFATWLVAPQPSGLSWAQGDVPAARGPLASRWIVGPRAKRFKLTVSAPRMTSGTVAVPLLGRRRTIAEDGRIVWNGSRAVGSSRASSDGTAVDFPEVTGTHTWAW